MAAHLKEFLTDRRILFLLSMLVIYCIACLFSADYQWVGVAAGSGIVIFYIIEYIIHRFNIYNVTYHIGFGFAAFLVTWNIHLACAFMLGITLYQLYYEWSHFVTHRAIIPLTPWGKGMERFQLMHHFKSSEHYFGVTNSSIDSLVGTYPSREFPMHKHTGKL